MQAKIHSHIKYAQLRSHYINLHTIILTNLNQISYLIEGEQIRLSDLIIVLLLQSYTIQKIFTENYDEWNIVERPTRGSNRIYGIGVRDESLRLVARVAARG